MSVAVVTSDGQVVLMQRSQAVSEGQGLLDVPGGHPEPANLGFESMHDHALSAGVTPDAVCAEIFESAAAEVRAAAIRQDSGEEEGEGMGPPSLAWLW